MNLNKTTLSIALSAILSTGTTQATIIDMDYSGLFTWVSETNVANTNNSTPYYYDATWGYGVRTQISGTLQIDTETSSGSATVNPFAFQNAGNLVIYDFELKNIGNDLLLGNFNFNWNGSDVTSQIVLDASGLFTELTNGPVIGDLYDADTCAISSTCATPASNDLHKTQYPIGPSPVATTSLNTMGQVGFGTTLNQLSLGTDDGIGGSPMDNGPFSGFSNNFDMTALTVTNVRNDLPLAMPIPASIWLFGTGLLTLGSIARRRKK